jgi:hypothetical protein
VAALVTTLTTLVTALVPALPAAVAQGSPAPPTPSVPAPTDLPAGSPLSVSAVSPWVEPDGVFRVRLSPSAGLPPDAELTYTIGQRIGSGGDGGVRDALEAALDEPADGPSLRASQTVPLLELVQPPDAIELQIPIRSSNGDADRVFIPNAGVHPVALEVTTADGSTLWEQVVFLNRLPEEMPEGRDGAQASTAVQLVAGIDSAPALGPDGSPALTADDRAAVTEMQRLLTGSADLPLVVSLRPNTLLALQRTGDAADSEFLTAATGARWLLGRQSYVRVDAGALQATGSAELQRQVGVGDATLAAWGGTVDPTLWYLDDTVDAAAAPTLGALGVRHLVMSAERLEEAGDGAATATNRTLAIAGQEDMTVTAYDPQLTQRLRDPATSAGLKAHQVISMVMADWFDATARGATAFPGVSATIALPPGIDPEALDALAGPLLGEGPVRIEPSRVATGDDDGPLSARIARRAANDMTEVVRRTAEVTARIASSRTITPADPGPADGWDQVNDQAPAQALDELQRQAIWSSVDAGIDAQVAAIEVPRSRTVLLTARASTIPLRMRNDLATEVRLRMSLRSPRLDFPAGEVTDIVLAPGENRIDVPVEVRAAGSAPLRIELTSPDGGIGLPDSTLRVRSSSISGVGAVLSTVSLAFLLWWWLAHRRRRSAARSDGGDGG